VAFNVSSLFRISQQPAIDGGFDILTLSGDKVLVDTDSCFLAIDPGGAGRNVRLPRVSKSDAGRFVVVFNKANADEGLVFGDYAGSAITDGTFTQNTAAIFYVTAAGAWALFGKFTIVAD
tara:strand:- start:350 stop:709 length:360 start_codon:yes stop_codon:yes gene_type:complete